LLRATFIPTLRFDKDFLLALVAVLGTTISPSEFFWQSSEEVEELVQEHAISHEGERPAEGQLHLRYVRWDTAFGMFFSNLIMYFIILVSALTLGVHGITNVDTAAQAAQALRPLAGSATFALFSLGIMSAGLISIPVIAGSSAYAVTGALDLPGSLAERPSNEPVFYSIIVGTSLAGLLVNALPIPPFRLLFYSAVLSGIISPVMIFMVINLARSSRVMGRHTNSSFSNALGWILFAIMTASLLTWIVFTLR
jgi:Mn2+/Fe2+ NRAMP family transporter